MSNSKNVRIPRKGVNPEILRNQLNQKERAIAHHQESLGRLARMVEQNCRIIGQLIGMIEVLKDKGMVTNDEINAKLKELDEKNQKAAKEALEAERKILVANQEREREAREKARETLKDLGVLGVEGTSEGIESTEDDDASVINNDSKNPA